MSGRLRILTTEEARIIDALRAPDRWQPDEPLTKAEAEAWGANLQSPIGLKIDVAMINLAQQQAQMAVHATTADVARMAGYAAGFRAAWVLAKALSTMAGTDAGKSENDATTGAAGLDHLNP